MIKNIRTKLEYLFLLVIVLSILIQLSTQKSLEEETSAVILNLNKETNAIENPGSTTVNVTIYEENIITGSVVLEPRESSNIEKENFKAIGEEYE